MLRIIKSANHSMKNAGTLYMEYIDKILLVGATIVLPIQILMVISLLVVSATVPVSLQDETIVFFFVLAITFCQMPFINILHYDENSEGRLLKVTNLYKCVFDRFTLVYIFSLLYAAIVTIGYSFFLIPGLILGVIFFYFPYQIIINNQESISIKENVLKVMRIGVEKFPSIFSVICFVAFIETFVWWGVSNTLFKLSGRITNTTLILFHMCIDVIVFPFLVFIIGSQFIQSVNGGNSHK